MSLERRKMLALLGAELALTPAAHGMKGALAKAEELLAQIPDAVIPQQFENPANPEIHRPHHGGGNLERYERQYRLFRRRVGTGGTITGVGQALKPRRAALRIVAVEPEDSAVLRSPARTPQDSRRRRRLRACHSRSKRHR